MPQRQFDDSNRAFLQAFMARGTMTTKQGREVLAAIFTIKDGRHTPPSDVSEDDFTSYLGAAAEGLSPYDYEIRSTQHQLTKERIHAVVNANSDPITQLATTRTEVEMFFVKRMIDAMFETYNTRRREVMAVTSIDALRREITKGINGRQSLDGTQGADKGVTNDQAERCLSGLVAEGWFERSKEGYYTLSPRALLELQTWLVDQYNDDEAEADAWQPIKFCEACKGIMTVGRRCADLDCNVRIHDICMESYFNSRPSMQCPNCETAWDGKQFVGQRAITSTEDYLKGKRRSGAGKKNPVVVAVEEEEEDAEEEGEEDVEQEEEEESEPEPEEQNEEMDEDE